MLAPNPGVEILLGLGGNVGDPAAAIRSALAALASRGVRILACSRLYSTPPWGPVAQRPFVNASARGITALSARELLGLAQAVEAEHGRSRNLRYGPRTLDIDILDYGGVTLDEPGLNLPHPRLTERGFVLVPLAEIAPERLIRGRSVADWAGQVDHTGIVPLEPDTASPP